jgi:2-polyprenyl-6-methoxyphenol hydroxylase-like FAD-dependent oxidoreductase
MMCPTSWIAWGLSTPDDRAGAVTWRPGIGVAPTIGPKFKLRDLWEVLTVAHTQESQEETPAPVLIAGGGPVGLATAVELAHHGVASVVLERRQQVSAMRPRAKTTSARTMEHFRRWGLADELRDRAPLPCTWSDRAVFCTTVLGKEITHFDKCFGLDLTGSDLVAEPGQQVAQPVVEGLLRESAARSPHIKLLTGYDVMNAGQTPDGTWLRARDQDGIEHRFEASYIVGCEGGQSVVRGAMGALYEGSDDAPPTFNMVFRAPGLAELIPHGPAIHYWVLNPEQPGLVGPMDLVDTWWCGALGLTAIEGEEEAASVVCSLLGESVPVEVLAIDMWRASIFLADRYANGRFFIAGDAAHQNPPWGGHGFNTGIGDAVNIGWKLAAVINGWAPATLLDTYDAERRPIALNTIEEAKRNMAALTPASAKVMATLPPSEVAAAVQRAKDSEFHSLTLTLGYDYEGSPIISEEHAAESIQSETADREYVPTAAPGHRLPHRWLSAGDSLYDHLGPEFTLISAEDNPAGKALVEMAAELNVPLVLLDEPAVPAVEAFGAPLVLVRPDQHVAWRGIEVEHAAYVLRRAVGYLPE